MKWICLIVGGSLGTVLRYLIANQTCRFIAYPFYGTITVNLIGCFLIGFISFVLDKNFPAQTEWRLLLIVGFLGAFTTFSTFIFDSAVLMNQAKLLAGFLNVFISVVGGFLLFILGSYAGKIFCGA